MSEQKFYKLAHPSGWDFYTGKTINYRENIGKEVRCPNFNKNGKLCSDAFIYASRKPEGCFVGANIPCSAYRVRGTPIFENNDKCGFEKLFIIEELKPEKLFEWNYAEAINLIRPFTIIPPKIITEKHLKLLKIWASVRASVRDSVWASVEDSVWAYIGSLFPLPRKAWKYTENIPCRDYPFQPAVDLWKLGLVPSFDSRIWRLHGGPKAKVLWKGQIEEKEADDE